MKYKICENKKCKYRYTNGWHKWHYDFKFCPYCGIKLKNKIID